MLRNLSKSTVRIHTKLVSLVLHKGFTFFKLVFSRDREVAALG